MKKIKILILSSALVTLFSCQKLLEIKETDFIGGDVALKTVLNNEQGVIGAYAAMNVEMGILLNAVFADEVVTADFYNAATVHEWQYGTQDVSIRDQYTAITLYYRIIDRVNRVLQALPQQQLMLHKKPFVHVFVERRCSCVRSVISNCIVITAIALLELI